MIDAGLPAGLPAEGMVGRFTPLPGYAVRQGCKIVDEDTAGKKL